MDQYQMDELAMLESTQHAGAPVLIQASNGQEISSWLWTIAFLLVAVLAGVACGLSIHNTIKLSGAPKAVKAEIESSMLLLHTMIMTGVNETAQAQSTMLAGILDDINTALASLDARVSALEGEVFTTPPPTTKPPPAKKRSLR